MPVPRDRWKELTALRPGSLIGYCFDLQRLADKVLSGEIALDSVNRAVFALTDCGTNPVRGAFRTKIWRAFGVPVYELIIATGCRVLAAECEFHSGWHVQPGASAYLVNDEVFYNAPPLAGSHTGFTGQIDTQLCQCGRPAIRLKNLSPFLPLPFERRLAAIA